MAMSDTMESTLHTSTHQSRLASCVCGGYKLYIHGDPIRLSICHCFACQQRTGSVFGVQARFHSYQILQETGSYTIFSRIGDEGSTITYKFCPTCGSTVSYTLSYPGMEGFVVIPVGALSDPNIGIPVYSVYEARMHSWVKLPPEIEHID